MQFNNGFDALARFEGIRALLGHENVLDQDNLAELKVIISDQPIPPGSDLRERILVRYQEMLDVVAERNHIEGYPDGVLPDVRPTEGRVFHTTCSANTSFEACVDEGGYILMRRPGEAIDPDDGFTTAMAVLAGYMAGWDADAAPPEGVGDPRVSAREYLAHRFGDEEADRLVAGYIPHWPSWQAEQRCFRVEEQLRPLRELRNRLAGQYHATPPTILVEPTEEPLADWERELLEGM